MDFPEHGTQIVEPHDEEERWRWALRSPRRELRPWIRGYCHYETRAEDRGTHQHLPHRSVTLIIALEGAIETGDSAFGGSCRIEAGEGFLAGLHTTAGRTRGAVAQRGLEVKLGPIAAHLLLGGVPMEELTGRAMRLDDLLGGRVAGELGARLVDAADEPDRAFDVLEGFLAPRILRPVRAPDPRVVCAWQALAASDGRARIGLLADELGWSRRRLGDAFRTAVGLGTKTTARVLRFDAAMERWKRAPHTPWIDVALESGYSDQAHFSREVRALCGQSPRELASLLRPASGAIRAPEDREEAGAPRPFRQDETRAEASTSL